MDDEAKKMQEILNNFVMNGRLLSKQGEQLADYLNKSIRPQKNKRIKGKRSIEDVKKLSNAKGLDNDELEAIYANYYLTYDSEINSRKDIIEKPKNKTYFPTTDQLSTEEKLDNLINRTAIYHKPLSKNDFEKIIKDWDKGDKTIDEWYKIYYNRIFEQPGWTIQLKHPETITYMVYKSPSKRVNLKKYTELTSTGDRNTDIKLESEIRKEVKEEKAEEDYIPNSFPLKSNKKYFQHSVFNPGTYMIDIMFTGNLAYLIAINANTRYLFAELLTPRFRFGNGWRYGVADTVKNSKHFIDALQKLIDRGMNPKVLIGDDEGCFNSDETKEFYGDNIEFKKIVRMTKGVYPKFMPKQLRGKTEPLHSSLGIIDRVIRTLRDMAYNVKIGVIKKEEMDDLVKMYNNAPHKTLTYYAGDPTTPLQVQNNPDLEKFIIRKICQDNFNIKKQDGFELEENSYVKVYNEPDKFQKRRSIIQPGRHQIGKFHNGLYEVFETETGKVQYLPRYRLQPENRRKYSKVIEAR